MKKSTVHSFKSGRKAVALAKAPSVFSENAFRGRVYGITGGAHGIGEATARQLISLGASVTIIDQNPIHLKRVEADMKDSGDLFCVLGDVDKDSILRKAIKGAHRRWGRIDGWVNNAAYNPASARRSLGSSARNLEKTWKVNIRAAWNACEMLLPLMKDSGGAIVNISSILAHAMQLDNTMYGMTKAAVEGMTRGLAVDFAKHRIRVNAIIPGGIDTRWPCRAEEQDASIPASVLKRLVDGWFDRSDHYAQTLRPWPNKGEACHVASSILFLLSDAAAHVTGVCLPVDGGESVYRVEFNDVLGVRFEKSRKWFSALRKKYPKLSWPCGSMPVAHGNKKSEFLWKDEI